RPVSLNLSQELGNHKTSVKGETVMDASVVMTKTVIVGKPDTTVKQAAELMTRNQISAIPVLNKMAASWVS
ncbi:MAG: CBS domain-containing protein, partial [Roseovarius sp.]|nr:CBS domain-containing protein [Roseovarius sp.]